MENNINKKERLHEIIDILKDNNILSGINPEKLRTIIEQLGPTFIKIGQIMSSRTDLIPEDYSRELTKLRSEVTPMNFSEVQEILNNEYNQDYNNIFEMVNGNCIGSASIAQVHEAILKNGKKVVIKVQRKNIESKMATDIELLKQAINILHIELIIHHIVDLNSFLDEMYNTAKEEMDFITESNYMEEFRKNNEDVSYISIPKVYKNLTTSHVLVMEYIEGINILDKNSLTKKNYITTDIASKLANCYIKQAIYDGLFQADPHPDNFKIKDGLIVFLDFGMMGRTNTKEREILKNCIRNIVKQDNYEIVENLIVLCSIKICNHRQIEIKVKDILDKYATSSLKEISVINFFNDIYKMLKEENIRLPKDITMLIRGIIVIEGLLKELDPNISLFQVLALKVKEEEIKKLKNGDYALSSAKKLIHAASSTSKIPNEILTLVRNVNNGETKFSVELNNSNKQVDKIEVMLHEFIIGMLDASVILGACLLSRSEEILLRNIFLTISFILSTWLFIKMYIDHKTKGM